MAGMRTGMAVTAAFLVSGAAMSAREAHKKAPVTFNKDIAPLVFQNCATCHRPGEVAPFSLLSYADVKKRAKQIAMVTGTRFMPPWKADSHGEFVNERRLTDTQISLIKDWAAQGAPEGATAKPEPPKYAEAGGLGAPDATFEPGEAYNLGAEGTDVYRCFVIPTTYSEDRWVSAIEVKPGNRNIVHHVLVFLDTTGTARKMAGKDGQPGYTTFGGVGFAPSGGLGGWAPGNMPHPLPQGVGQFLPKGAYIVLQVHYHRSGKPETDKTRIGVYFCKGPVDKRVRTSMVINPFIAIPPGEANHSLTANLAVPSDVTVLNVTPHMHLLGKEMTVTASLPDGSKRQLVKVPDWDFNWQTTYTFKDPLKLPKGSNVSLAAKFDNSDSNPRNPNRPAKLVTFGEQTTNEMCIAFVGYTVDAEHLTKGQVGEGMWELGGGRRRQGASRITPEQRERIQNFLKNVTKGSQNP